MGTTKAAITLDSGLSMIEHVYLALSKVCSRIVFVGHAEGVPQSVLCRGVQVTDEIPNLGPLGAVDALLSSGVAEQYLITPCDLFQVRPELYRLLLRGSTKSAVILRHQERVEPLIGLYSTQLLPLVREQMSRQQLSMRGLLAACNPEYIEVPEHLRSALQNANLPEDLLAKQ